jgi:hypothetical protein
MSEVISGSRLGFTVSGIIAFVLELAAVPRRCFDDNMLQQKLGGKDGQGSHSVALGRARHRCDCVADLPRHLTAAVHPVPAIFALRWLHS